LPVTDKTPFITLGEGGTPLTRLSRIPEKLGVAHALYVKYEGANPTSSFKDRGMSVTISKAVEENARAVICASTGNTSASAAAYAARAGLECFVIVPAASIALGKLAQAMIHRARVVSIRGGFDDALNYVKHITENYSITLVNSLNPYRLEGQKTASFEIIDELGSVPDLQFMPVGNAANITAYHMGYKEYKTGKSPVLYGAQAKGANPIVRGKPVKNPKTIATAIRIGNPARWKEAEKAAAESGGKILDVTDEEIKKAYMMLAGTEGIFVEPASAAGFALYLKMIKTGKIKKSESLRIVIITTGNGLKDPDFAVKHGPKPVKIPSNLKAVLKALKL